MPLSPAGGPDALALLRTLVGFDTVSTNSNLELIAFVSDYLSDYGIRSTLIEDDTGSKADLIATIGPGVGGGLMLAGHTDVVPVEGQEWTTDPFEAVEKDGRLFGRGTCDMKGFLAAVLAAVPALTAAPLKKPVHLAFTFDEEIGCFGGQALARHLSELTVRPACCIVGEPTSMGVVNAHKGKLSVDCQVLGAECHSAYLDRGVNAVEIAAEIVARLRAAQGRLRSDGPLDHGFDPPFTTIHTGRMAGGIARNIVPRDCRFEFEIRNLPDQDPHAILDEIRDFIGESLLPEMRTAAPESGVSLTVQSDIPALAPDERSAFLALTLQLTGANAPDRISFATEAGLYRNVGIPTLVCGPGDIAQAHKPDEFVALEQIGRCESFLADIIAANENR